MVAPKRGLIADSDIGDSSAVAQSCLQRTKSAIPAESVSQEKGLNFSSM